MSAQDLPDSAVWHEVIQGVGTGDLASPGVGGPPNRAPQMLADRTRYLYEQLKPISTILLAQNAPVSLPGNLWVPMVYQVVNRNDTDDALTVPLDYIRVPLGITEVKVQATVALNAPLATTRVVVAIMSLINMSAPVNGGFDAFNRYGANFFPGASMHSGWIPVVQNDRVQVGVHTNLSASTLSSSVYPLYAEILMR